MGHHDDTDIYALASLIGAATMRLRWTPSPGRSSPTEAPPRRATISPMPGVPLRAVWNGVPVKGGDLFTLRKEKDGTSHVALCELWSSVFGWELRLLINEISTGRRSVAACRSGSTQWTSGKRPCARRAGRERRSGSRRVRSLFSVFLEKLENVSLKRLVRYVSHFSCCQFQHPNRQ